MDKHNSNSVCGRFSLGSLLRKTGRTSFSSINVPSSSSALVVADTNTEELGEKTIHYNFASSCSFVTTQSLDNVWRPDDKSAVLPSYIACGDRDVYRPDVLKTIEAEIERVKEDLRTLSLDIHSHPEIMFKEKCVSPLTFSPPCTDD